MNKQIFFLHIPKTGGSSINHFLDSVLGSGISHIQGQSDLEEVKKVDCYYLSGHVSYAILEGDIFNRDNYFVITMLRNPIAQVLDEFNWLLNIQHVEKKTVAEEIWNISDEIDKADCSKPEIVMDIYKRHAWLFQNAQTRILSSKELDSLDSALSNLKKIDLVGVTERFDSFLTTFCKIYSIARPDRTWYENPTLIQKIDIEWVEQNPEVLSFLAEYNSKDICLYQNAFRISLQQEKNLYV